MDKDGSVTEPSADVLVTDDQGWSEIRLNRARRRNALSSQLVDELLEAFACVRRGGVEVVLFSAEGPVFCAGGDTSERWPPSAAPGTRLLNAFAELDVAVVALVEGPAVGAGMALVACCPVAVASSEAWFALPEVSLGLYPGGPLPFLDAIMPPRTAFSLGLSGSRLSAEEARVLGLVTEVATPESAREAAQRHVEALVAGPRQAHQAREYWQRRFRTDDFRERRRWALEITEI